MTDRLIFRKPISGACVGAAYLLLGACQAPPSVLPKGPVRVLTYRVEGTIASGPSFSGTIHARFESDLAFRVGGKVAQRLVEVGDRVTAGQVLLKLDPSDYAHASDAATANVAAAQAQADRANANYDRIKALLETGSAAPDAFEQAKAARDSAQAGLSAAKAQLATAADQRDYTELKADATGVVAQIDTEAGQVVAAGTPVLRLARDGQPEAVVGLPSPDHAAGEAASAQIVGAAPAPISAHLRQISQVADPATRLFEARYVLDTGRETAPLGATVNIGLPQGASKVNGTDIPLSALLDRGDGTQVWVLDPSGLVHSRPVKVAHLNEDTATLSDGLRGGEVIIAAGAQLLHDGERVTPVSGSGS